MEILIILLVAFAAYVVLATYVFSSFQDRCFRNLWSGQRTGVFQEEQKTYNKLFLHYEITFDDPFFEDETIMEKVSKLTSDAYSFDMRTGTRNGISVASMLANEISRRRQFDAPIDKPFETPVKTLVEEPTILWRENLEIAPGIWVSPKPNCISSVLARFKNHGLIDLNAFERKRAYKDFSDADEPFTEAASKFREMISDPFGQPFFRFVTF